MKTQSIKSLLRIGLGMLALVLALGCAKEKNPILIENRRPEVRLTSAPIDTSSLYFYSYTVNWVGFDPDGRVDHYLFTIDPHMIPPGQDTVWQRTEDNERRLFFKSGESVTQPGGLMIGRDFHVFLIKAVDDAGSAGPYSSRAFYSYTVAPDIRIRNPRPGAAPAYVTPSVRISWTGNDPDGVFTTKPVKYKHILLSASSSFPKDLAIQNPDSLRRYYGVYWKENGLPGPWAGWDSTSADTQQVQFTNLTPGSEYVFAVIGFDEAGAYSPIFDFQVNMLRLRIGFAAVFGPKITMFNEFFNFTYPTGGFCVCEKSQVKIEVPGRVMINVNWSAEPPPGADIRSYRWALDIEDVFDDTPRTDDLRDLAHWSSPSAGITSASVGPFRGGEIHFFYIEATDNNGLKSLGILRLTIVEPTFENPLLIVDDTRLRADIGNPGMCVQLPSGPWPTAAEADTFLYARGGFPWKCYPDGSVALPGIFAGYDFDTLGTRVGKTDLTVPLSILGKYRHIIWMVDGPGAQFDDGGIDPVRPGTALRYMGRRGGINTLAAFVKQGGKVWTLGGGAGGAATFGFNDPTNDRQPVNPTITFSITGARGELGPGRYMYDIAKWQSEFRMAKVNVNISKSLGRFHQGAPDNITWTAYQGLPDRLDAKTRDSDPVSAEAPGRRESSFYQTGLDIEFLQLENNVIQDIDPDPDVENEQSTLDTLYRVKASTLVDQQDDPALRPRFVVMTYHHGPPPASASIVHSGFPLWFFRRTQTQQLVDYVLQTIWNIPKAAVSPGPARVSAAAMSPQIPATGVLRRAAPVGAMKPSSTRNARD